ncbi:MAG: MBL fold metallo-hydrolase [Clostridia bacterium]|nr:MBL fold metallo-hydrolase [Clostridia bacterium]
MIPFRIIGNLYFVGTYGASSHMIDTGKGLILIDAGYEETADVVIESLETLGYDVKDVKYILISHGHDDHSDGVPKLVARSGAKVFMHEADNRYLKGFLPDVYLKDGDTVRLGNTEILCLHTPGHTAGVMSFFFNVTDGESTYRAGMFGGAGVNQLKKAYLDKKGMLPLSWRADYLASLERLRGERVEVFVGNHSWNNRTREKFEQMQADPTVNPFINRDEWGIFLDKCEAKLENMIETESRETFVNYAHRGASEYMPENTFLSFYNGIAMGANGIETDVRRTADGKLILFHDSTLERVTDGQGRVDEHTYAELMSLNVEKNGFYDKIVTLEEFLQRFAFRELTFAIELKGAGVEEETAELLRKYGMEKKTFVTSFNLEYIRKFKEYAPEFRVGYLTKEIDGELLSELRALGVDELCPKASEITPEKVRAWHRAGFNVRAWGVDSEETMRRVYDSGANGMTVNFPDKLTEYIKNAVGGRE